MIAYTNYTPCIYMCIHDIYSIPILDSICILFKHINIRLHLHIHTYTHTHARMYTLIYTHHIYTLTHIYIHVKVDPVDIPKYFSSTADIIRLADHTACDAVLVQKLVLKLQIVPLTKQLTNLSGVYKCCCVLACTCV